MSRRRRAATVKIVQPKKLPGEVAWTPAFQYRCTSGHWVEADQPVARCPMTPLGQPCTGALRACRTEAVAS